MVEVEHLIKRFRGAQRNAVDDISFEVGAGEFFALLGPNGAGKSTTVGILITRIRPTDGKVTVAGYDVVHHPRSVKRHIAVVPQRVNLDRSLTAKENLIFHALYFGVPARIAERRAVELLSLLGLVERSADRVDRFSGGQAQQLMIARALMHDPDILFLDEPTTGLDPQTRLFLWDTIVQLNGRGLTVLLTTHDMDEADQLCHRLAIMDHGKILALDTPYALKRMVPGGNTLEMRVRRSQVLDDKRIEQLLSQLKTLPGVERAEITTQEGQPINLSEEGKDDQSANGRAEPIRVIRLYSGRGGDLAAQAADTVSATGAELVDLRLTRPSLETVFVSLTGRGLRS